MLFCIEIIKECSKFYAWNIIMFFRFVINKIDIKIINMRKLLHIIRTMVCKKTYIYIYIKYGCICKWIYASYFNYLQNYWK